MMRQTVLMAALLLSVWMLHAGTVRKKDDPILNTQTNPIALKDKMEEIKDGEKGAPSPSFKNYPKSQFLTEPPMEDKPGSESDRSFVKSSDEHDYDETPEGEDWWERDLGVSDENSFKETAGKDEAGNTLREEEKPSLGKGKSAGESKS